MATSEKTNTPINATGKEEKPLNPSVKDLIERLKTMNPSFGSLLAGNPMNRLILSTFNSTDGKHYVTMLFRMVPEASILLINLYYTVGPTDFNVTVTSAVVHSAATFVKGMDLEMLTTYIVN